MVFQINSLNSRPDLSAMTDKIPEIFPCNFALCANFPRLLSFTAQLLCGALEADFEAIGWTSEDSTD